MTVNLEENQQYSRQALMSKFEEMLEYVESACKNRQAAHQVELGIFRMILEIGRMALGMFFSLCGTGDQGEEMTLPDGKVVRRLKPFISVNIFPFLEYLNWHELYMVLGKSKKYYGFR